MAEEVESPLCSLEEELTCSICLSPFDCPVTIPCGHNFCQDCLLASWEDCSYSCPQCRTMFPIRPELKKNTVLSTVVEAFKQKSSTIPTEKETKAEEPSKPEEKHVVLCDTCMQAEASKTCLTCMASYCEEHLRPHRENPTFRVHQLIEPVGDLSEHICSEHHKLMEHFCTEHQRLICSSCLQQLHKSCSFSSPEEQRSLKENDFRAKLSLLNEKIERTDHVVFQINDMQSKLKDAANSRKTAMSAAYQQLKDMLAQDERAALHELDCELEKGQEKLQHFAKRFSENNEKMRTAREGINELMGRAQTTAFLQASFELPKVIKFDPYAPRINLDSERVTAAHSFAADLKASLMEILSQPFEARPPLLTSGDAESSGSESEPESTEDEPSGHSAPEQPPKEGGFPSLNTPAPPTVHTIYQQVPVPVYMQPQQSWNKMHYNQFGSSGFSPGRQNFHGQKFKKPSSGKKDTKGPHKPAQKAHQNSGGDRSQTPQNKGEGRKPPSASGGQKPAAAGPRSTKEGKPGGRPPSAKPPGQQHHPKRNK
ncbi:E3 ubiquitin/ISG15 ligase TRIM25 [Oryzias melastigma]|uniref:E3 ubiquitin/ISG15 ligase TRIM25 n=1 Tax=Oryzias melastigma TaxID=30732 RepID=UPI000CF7C067|nr:E3 ubiquitin/ISG15 ligase TRIM25 [Oryzias melastigma]